MQWDVWVRRTKTEPGMTRNKPETRIVYVRVGRAYEDRPGRILVQLDSLPLDGELELLPVDDRKYHER